MLRLLFFTGRLYKNEIRRVMCIFEKATRITKLVIQHFSTAKIHTTMISLEISSVSKSCT